MKSWEDIPGWFDFSETYDSIIISQPGGLLVEVGTYLGRSLCYLGQKVKESGKSFNVVGVDHCRGSGVENGRDNHCEAVQESGGYSFAGQLVQNILECGLQGTVSLLIADSSTAANMFADNSLAMLFLDASHDYSSLKKDILDWLPKVKIGGVIGGDDVGVPGEIVRVWPDVKVVLDELLPGWVYSPHDAWIYTKRN